MPFAFLDRKLLSFCIWDLLTVYQTRGAIDLLTQGYTKMLMQYLKQKRRKYQKFKTLITSIFPSDPDAVIIGEIATDSGKEIFRDFDIAKIESFIKTHNGEINTGFPQYKINKDDPLTDRIDNLQDYQETYDLIVSKFQPQDNIRPIKLIRPPSDWNMEEKSIYCKRMVNYFKNRVQDNPSLVTVRDYLFILTEVENLGIDLYNNICGCLGPCDGQPLCPCHMRNVFQLDDKWFSATNFKKEMRISPVTRKSKESKHFLIKRNRQQLILVEGI